MKHFIHTINHSARTAATLLLAVLMLAAVPQRAGAQTPATIGGITYDADGGYYVIDEPDDLRDLATYVNGTGTYRDNSTETTAHDCSGLKFKMANDIAYTYSKAWNDAGSTQNNFVAIGGYDGTNYRRFQGDFDGAGHTISGIRIHRSGSAYADWNQGIFGQTGEGANIHGLRLADTRITGSYYTGGIVGYDLGTVTDCHVASNVCIHAAQSNTEKHGGIAGYNVGTVEGCTSAATLTIASTFGCYFYGAIAGYNEGGGTLRDNLAIGATVPAANNERYGAIAGYNYGTLQRNYYTACTVAGVENATGKGCMNADVTANDGAVSVHTITLGEGITITSPDKPTVSYGGTDYYKSGVEVTFSNNRPGYMVDYASNDVTITDGAFTMPASDVTISATLTVIPWAGDGSQSSPYIIEYPSQLDLLAHRVNGTHGETLQSDGYSGKYFRLGADIAYTYTTAWNDASSTENNFEAIGVYYNDDDRYFKGNFDGDGHTISGIRIHRSGTADADNYQGIFGRTKGATIHGIRLADARITGYDYTGGIVGHAGRTVTDCHVANNVCIHAVRNYAWYHGGIVGYNDGTVASCTSAATLTIASDASRCQYYGAIAGLNSSIVTLRNNLAIGATVPAAYDNLHGAIAGSNNGYLQRNYYTACTVAGVENATGKGCRNADVATDDGAVPALRDQADNTHAIALLAALAQTDADRPVLPLDLGWGAGQFPLQLAGRTLYKDGDWNTLCLPFSLVVEGSPLDGDGVEVKTLESSAFDAGTLTMNFSEASPTTLTAGTPYIIRWTGIDADAYAANPTAFDLANPVFQSVAVGSTTAATETATSVYVDFIGTYAPATIYEDGTEKHNLYLGNGNTLYYPTATGFTVNALRGYFRLKNGLTAGEPAGPSAGVRAFNLNFGDKETGITTTDFTDSTDKSAAWYDLNGRKLDGKPTQKGIYINNGKKVIIK